MNFNPGTYNQIRFTTHKDVCPTMKDLVDIINIFNMKILTMHKSSIDVLVLGEIYNRYTDIEDMYLEYYSDSGLTFVEFCSNLGYGRSYHDAE